MDNQSQTWLFGRTTDLFILFVPVWVTWAAAFILPQDLLRTELPLWGWIVFILALDVSHVWSTIYRTYFDKQEIEAHRTLLWAAPAVSLGILLLVNLAIPQYFWRVMAYFALYHFIKQQYGFMMIYIAKNRLSVKRLLNEKIIIYLAMLYPVFYWHVASPRLFFWFQQDDFFNFNTFLQTSFSGTSIEIFWQSANVLFWLLMLGWAAQEIYLYAKHKLKVPYGKLLWLLSTAGNWYLGIVFFNSDIVFSITNVVAHGVPYLTLIFFYVEKKKLVQNAEKVWNWRKTAFSISMMLLGILLLAYMEEYFWDGLVYRENPSTFEFLFTFPFGELESRIGLAIGISLLSLPQVTHYVLDGFIWKNNKSNPFLKPVLFKKL